MANLQRIAPCLWFDTRAEEAANYYCGIFRSSRINRVEKYTEAGHEVHHKPAGSVMVVEFELDGQKFTALNGGPEFTFNEAVSLQVFCEDQAEIDYYWDKLTAGGKPVMCGWLEDRYGVSWQIVPKGMDEYFSDKDPKRAERMMRAIHTMVKLDIAKLEEAAR